MGRVLMEFADVAMKYLSICCRLLVIESVLILLTSLLGHPIGFLAYIPAIMMVLSGYRFAIDISIAFSTDQMWEIQHSTKRDAILNALLAFLESILISELLRRLIRFVSADPFPALSALIVVFLASFLFGAAKAFLCATLDYSEVVRRCEVYRRRAHVISHLSPDKLNPRSIGETLLMLHFLIEVVMAISIRYVVQRDIRGTLDFRGSLLEKLKAAKLVFAPNDVVSSASGGTDIQRMMALKIVVKTLSRLSKNLRPRRLPGLPFSAISYDAYLEAGTAIKIVVDHCEENVKRLRQRS